MCHAWQPQTFEVWIVATCHSSSIGLPAKISACLHPGHVLHQYEESKGIWGKSLWRLYPLPLPLPSAPLSPSSAKAKRAQGYYGGIDENKKIFYYFLPQVEPALPAFFPPFLLLA